MNHTPGPWRIDPKIRRGTDGGKHAFLEIVNGSSLFWTAKVQTFDDDKGEYAANARLIAAAPDLLAVLKAMRDMLRTEPAMQGREWIHLGIQANDAISKAEVGV